MLFFTSSLNQFLIEIILNRTFFEIESFALSWRGPLFFKTLENNEGTWPLIGNVSVGGKNRKLN